MGRVRLRDRGRCQRAALGISSLPHLDRQRAGLCLCCRWFLPALDHDGDQSVSIAEGCDAGDTAARDPIGVNVAVANLLPQRVGRPASTVAIRSAVEAAAVLPCFGRWSAVVRLIPVALASQDSVPHPEVCAQTRAFSPSIERRLHFMFGAAAKRTLPSGGPTGRRISSRTWSRRSARGDPAGRRHHTTQSLMRARLRSSIGALATAVLLALRARPFERRDLEGGTATALGVGSDATHGVEVIFEKGANQRKRVSLVSGAGRRGPSSEPVGGSGGRSPRERLGAGGNT